MRVNQDPLLPLRHEKSPKTLTRIISLQRSVHLQAETLAPKAEDETWAA
jgi:hypothetical protein